MGEGGDAGTKFFHAHATIRHRKKSIIVLHDSLGNNRTTYRLMNKKLNFYGKYSKKEWEGLILIT